MIDVVGHLEKRGVEYSLSGERVMVCCPFHDDHNPSCGIWVSTGYFQCFACHEKGSFAEFIAEVDGVSLHEALRSLRTSDDVASIETYLARVLDDSRDTLQYFNSESFHDVFKAVEGTPGYEYLIAKRRLKPEIITAFDVRWGDHGKYKNRVVLPIYTDTGKLLAYTARAVKDGMVPKTRKNRSPARALYGLYELKKSQSKDKRWEFIIIVEGEFDAMYLQGFGIPAVANMGTLPLNEHRIRLLRQNAKSVVLSYDGDEAGYRAMHGDEKKEGELEMLGRHLPTFAVHLPEGRDPNDLAEKEVRKIYGRFCEEN